MSNATAERVVERSATNARRRGALGFYWRRLRRSPVGMIGVAIISAVLFVAAFAPVLAPHDPTLQRLEQRVLPPAWAAGGVSEFPLGTDNLGRDVLSRLLYGSQVSVMVGVSGVLVSMLIGVNAGLVAGFYGGRVDAVLGRITDTFLSIPFIVLALAVVGVLGPGLLNLIVVLGFV
ncbi:MAG: ABC transporter permease, partial [Armatimonadetes bacterium]|nr:ABC transporter permease [Armatimonadota bacterium]